MTRTQHINAFPPGSTIKQVFEKWKIRRSNFEPIQESDRNTFQINVTREMGKMMAFFTQDRGSLRLAFFRELWK